MLALFSRSRLVRTTGTLTADPSQQQTRAQNLKEFEKGYSKFASKTPHVSCDETGNIRTTHNSIRALTAQSLFCAENPKKCDPGPLIDKLSKTTHILATQIHQEGHTQLAKELECLAKTTLPSPR